MSVAFRLGFGRLAVISGVSASGVPRAFSATGSRLGCQGLVFIALLLELGS
jgi:hypothetical protein